MLNKLYLSLPFWLPEKVLFQPDLKVRSGVEEWDKKDQNTAQRSSERRKAKGCWFLFGHLLQGQLSKVQACNSLTEIGPKRGTRVASVISMGPRAPDLTIRDLEISLQNT